MTTCVLLIDPPVSELSALSLLVALPFSSYAEMLSRIYIASNALVITQVSSLSLHTPLLLVYSLVTRVSLDPPLVPRETLDASIPGGHKLVIRTSLYAELFRMTRPNFTTATEHLRTQVTSYHTRQSSASTTTITFPPLVPTT